MKNFIFILACVLLFSSCSQSKEGIVNDLIEAENSFQTEKVGCLLADSFMYYGSTDTLNKEAYLSRFEYIKPAEIHASIMNMQDLDSIIKTEEQVRTIVDLYLEIDPLIIQKRTYRFVDNKLASITVDSTLHLKEYTKSFDEKWTPFIYWVKDQYDLTESEIDANIKKYLSEYTNLPASYKLQYINYAFLQGTYVSQDCALYKKLTFKGKRTVTIYDAIIGFPFSTSYELDKDLVKIRTDKSDLLLQIKDSQTLIGEGFARGTFIKAN